MIALDTNVVLRLIVEDDQEQTRRAAELVAAGPVLVTPTVLLETEWVLRSRYSQPRDVIFAVLQRFVGLPTVVLADETAVERALAWYGAGLDFADALHLALADKATLLATFDRQFGRRAARLGVKPPVQLL